MVVFPNELDNDFAHNRGIALCIKAMINSLPEKYKNAIVLTELQGLTQEEAGEKSVVSLSCMKSRAQRARKKLKEMVMECCQIEFDCFGNVIDYNYKEMDVNFVEKGCESASFFYFSRLYYVEKN